MNTVYQKINTIFMRDSKGKIMPESPLSQPEFEYLRNLKWRAEEKIDGTNIRLEVRSRIEYQVDIISNVEYFETDIPMGVHFDVKIAGKTDAAQIPPFLLKHLEETYPPEKVLESLGLEKFIHVKSWEEHGWKDISDIPEVYVIYGEGYGAKIQKGGGNYIKNGNGFIVFDVKVDNIWLTVSSRNSIAEKLGAPIVPLIGYFTIDEAVQFVKEGFKSKISENPDYLAEGLVLRTDLGLLDRRGKRLITKIKYKDFK